jgi:hypothetical protein
MAPEAPTARPGTRGMRQIRASAGRADTNTYAVVRPGRMAEPDSARSRGTAGRARVTAAMEGCLNLLPGHWLGVLNGTLPEAASARIGSVRAARPISCPVANRGRGAGAAAAPGVLVLGGSPIWLRPRRITSSEVCACSGCDRSQHVTRVSYDLGSTTLVTTQRCLPILRSRVNPSFS